MHRALLAITLAACGSAAVPPPATPIQSAPAPTPAPTPAPAASIEDQLVHGTPTQAAFDDMIASLPGLSEARRAAIAKIGSTKEAPIRVPDIHYEYVWVAKVACNGGAGQVGMQSLLETPNGQLDELQFTCPGDPAERSAYFDFSADPTEQQMKKELGGGK